MSLIAAWGCAEGTGTTAADASGNSHSMTLGTGMGWGTGHSPNASGMQATNVTGTGAQASMAISPAACSLLGWVNPTDLTSSTTRPLMGLFNGSSSEFVLWAQRSTFGTPNVLQGNVRTAGGLVEIDGGALTASTFVHVALVYDGATITLYVNGSSVATASQSGSIQTTSQFLAGGANLGNGFAVFNDIRLYSNALNSSQVTACMNTAVATQVDPTTGTAHTATASLTVTPSRSAASTAGRFRTSSLTVTPARSAAAARGRYRTGSLAVSPQLAASRLHGHGRTAALSVSPAGTTAQRFARVRHGTLTVVPVMVPATSGGSQPATVRQGSWYQLLDVLRQSDEEFDYYASRPPLACPNDGEPLISAPPTDSGSGVELYCKFDGWQYPRDWVRPVRR